MQQDTIICFSCHVKLTDKTHPAFSSPDEWPDLFLPEYLSLSLQGGPDEYELSVWFSEFFDIKSIEDKAKKLGFSLSQISLSRQKYNSDSALEDNYAQQKGREDFQTRKFMFLRTQDKVQSSEKNGDIRTTKKIIHVWAPKAFGDGFHPTTAMCIETLEDLHDNTKQNVELAAAPFLDVGTGSGILALSAHNFWKMPVYATDIDENSLVALRENWARNKYTQSKLHSIQDKDLTAPLIKAHKPYGVVCANIIKSALLELMQQISTLQDKGGYLVLSGYLEDQAGDVAKAAKAHGYRSLSQKLKDGWICALFIKD